MRCAVFASGGGSNFGALIDRVTTGELHAQLSVLVVNNSKVGAVGRAQENGIPVEHIAPSHFATEEAFAHRLRECFQKYRVEFIVLAGYMKKLPSVIVQEFTNRIINIHPALLPAFGGKGMYGSRVHEAVCSYGAKVTGITVHFVDEEYDHGPIIYQDVVRVADGDTPETVAAKVLVLEHKSYWRVLEALASGAITVVNRKVTGEIATS